MSDFSWAQWLGSAVVAAGGWWFGYRTALHRFFLDQHAKERSAARALGADLNRIRRALGERASAYGAVVYGLTFEPPTFHRWSESIIPQLAAADPSIVSLCMELERQLSNFKTLVARYHATREEQAKAKEKVRQYKEARLSDEHPMGAHFQWAGNLLNAEASVKHLSEQMQEDVRLMSEHHTAARELIDRVANRLNALASSQAPEFWPLPNATAAVQDWGPDSSQRSDRDDGQQAQPR